MGGFYGSVQVRSEDRQQVKEAAEQVARTKGVKCLVGPALGGWVGVYPEKSGQDDSFGRDMAKRIAGTVLHLLVHDDDVMAYWLWRDGKLADSYWSRPGYFGEEDRREQKAMAGHPEVFSELAGGKVEPLRELLRRDREDVPFEVERLKEFASLLGIANAVTAYEYLKSGERDGIRGWKQFEELPSDVLVNERKAAQERRRQVTALKRQLKKSGLLLTEVSLKDRHLTACAAGNGFAVASGKLAPTQSTTMEWYDAPWGYARAVPVDLAPQVNRLACDGGRSRLAAAMGTRIVVWDVNDWRALREVPESDWAVDLALSLDGRLLAHSSRTEVVVTEVDSGQRTAVIPGASARELVFHPSGLWLAAGRANWTLGLVQLGEHPAPRWREMYVRGKRDPEPGAVEEVMRWLENLNLDEVARENRTSIEAALKQLAGTGKRALQEMKEHELANMCQHMERGFEQEMERLRAQVRDVKAGKSPIPPRPNEGVMSLEFTRDGRWLCCGTELGIRVYEWAEVVAAQGDDMPSPTRQYDIKCTDKLGHPSTYLYSIVEEATGAGVVFGGLTGQLYRMDLESGQVMELLTMPESAAIITLSVSRDGQALGIVSSTVLARHERRWKWSIWSYPRLVEHALSKTRDMA